MRKDGVIPARQELEEALDLVGPLHQADQAVGVAPPSFDSFLGASNLETCPPSRVLGETRDLSRSGRHNDALGLLDTASSTTWGRTPPCSHQIQIERSLVYLDSGRAGKALELAGAVVEELRVNSASRELGLALLALAGAQRSLARLGDASRTLTTAQHIFEWQLLDIEQTIRVLGLLAIIQKRRGKYSHAEEALERAIQLSSETQNHHRELQNRTNLAVLRIRMGLLQDAEPTLVEISDSVLGDKDHSVRTWASLGLSIVRVSQGKTRQSRELILRISRKESSRVVGREMILCLEYLADAAHQDGKLTRAKNHLDRALRRARADFADSDLICELQRRRSEILAVMGPYPDAMDAAKEAVEVGKNIGEPFELALANRSMGVVLEAGHDMDQAMACYRRCEEILRGIGERFELARTLIKIAALLRQLGSTDDARGVIQEADLLFGRMGLENWRRTCRSMISSLDEVATPRRVAVHKGPPPDTFGILSNDDRILRAFASLARVAQSKLPVLIEGESGTGKELFARALHGLSSRAKGPFLPLNCGAIPPDMQEAELFGHARGAFTGAISERIGYFESAHLGTLFLDEIGEMSLAAQTRLLRVLETDEFCRVGESRIRRLDVRYVAATNQVLDDAVSQREFRLDLFQRLNGLRIQIPALRSRPQDVDLLFRHFLEQFRHEDRPLPSMSRALMARLTDYPWPGNVRELRRAVERAVILASDTNAFDEEHFPFLGMDPADGLGNSLPDEMADMERGRLIEALEKTRWSKSGAARLLGMSRTTLNSKMQRHGIPLDVPARFRPPC